MGRMNEKVFSAPSKHCGKVCSTEEVLLRRTKAEQNQNPRIGTTRCGGHWLLPGSACVSASLSIISGD